MRAGRWRRWRRTARNRWWLTGVLVVAAGALVAVAALTILDRASLDDEGKATGVVPEQVPDDFPIPVGAAIGASTVDPATGVVTLEVTTAGSLVEAVSTHTIGLVSSGYVVDESAARGDGWVIRFSRQDLRGTVEVSGGPSGALSLITIRNP